jgi:pSer/pThr/pTyr-binding forkhead associated (FHA) protein
MMDPRLNSVHLGFPRREDFRRAREALLEARGLHTVALEKHAAALGDGSPFTMVQNQSDPAVPTADYWLMDQEGIYPLRVGVNTIGRLPDNDVVIQGPYVSRRHCAILVHAGDGCELYDIASKNGTYLNGLRLCGPTQLTSGDEIRMCDRQFIFMSKKEAKGQPGHGSTRVEP